ncbi:Putative iron-containing alcohol dehydrogenases [Desulfamplus magnetovallimortis]|uniref:Putative iron-containing alcohol dehydrogenases n=1 Tax=Desulfamplus magnetovallimortis TaxID=1246637 RepID=A0A1W1H4I7_9BACT|nr:iron-containing alcohol dehydrogenase [Desulfamplus magnetovallimortis]SLM27390.1 Putative iron-containing alcohol dehydrogenases [Desulfamplus magnetovallimortis]
MSSYEIMYPLSPSPFNLQKRQGYNKNMNFTFLSPVKIIFGTGSVDNLVDAIHSLHQSAHTDTKASGPGKILVVTGKNSLRASNIIQILEDGNLEYNIFVQEGEPTVEKFALALEKIQNSGIEMIVAIGGGSIIDTGKALSALITNTQNIMTYLEVIGKGSPLENRSLPMIAIPTTAGTGAEATCNAVLTSLEHKVKVSLRSPYMYPDIAIVDPLLCRSMPPHITASTGMDALVQLIESFTSKFSNPITDALCRDGIQRVARSLYKAWKKPQDVDARIDMSLAGLYSGITLANAKLGAVHGIAAPMGGMTAAPHGIICALLLAPVMRENIRTIQETQETAGETLYTDQALVRYLEISKILTSNLSAQIHDSLEWIENLVTNMNLPATAEINLTSEERVLLAEKAMNSSSMKGNPVPLNTKQLIKIINRSIP